MKRPRLIALGLAALFVAWVWPLPGVGLAPFSAHMAAHMTVVAVAAPLLALGVAGGRFDPATRAPQVVTAVPASFVELVVVWAWHAPALHHAARTEPLAYAAEQASFLGAGFLLWAAALGGTPAQRRSRAISGIAGMLLTSMHMTLLGALLVLTPRVLYAHGHAHAHGAIAPLFDQHVGGAIMILAGGAAYLGGGLALAAGVLRGRSKEDPA